jgi:hypothetical protein
MHQERLAVNDVFFEDLEAELEHERYQRARDALDPSDVLAETQRLMCEITEDAMHPLWPLIQACVEHGTLQESGCTPHVSAQVGFDLLPLIDRAIGILVQERLLQETDDGPF